MMRTVLVIVVVALVCVLNGCGYKFGNIAPNGIRSLHVDRVVVSKTCDEPRMGIYAAEKIRTAFVSDGSVKLSSADVADARLVTKVDDYRVTATGRTKLTPPDPKQEKYVASIWTVTVTVRFKVVRNGVDEKTLAWRTVKGRAIFSDVLDITTVRQAGIRQALVDASKKLVRESLDTDWKPVAKSN